MNFMSDDDQSKVKDNYGANFARLTQVKQVYDPDNLFHHNQNIPPAGLNLGTAVAALLWPSSRPVL